MGNYPPRAASGRNRSLDPEFVGVGIGIGIEEFFTMKIMKNMKELYGEMQNAK